MISEKVLKEIEHHSIVSSEEFNELRIKAQYHKVQYEKYISLMEEYLKTHGYTHNTVKELEY